MIDDTNNDFKRIIENGSNERADIKFFMAKVNDALLDIKSDIK